MPHRIPATEGSALALGQALAAVFAVVLTAGTAICAADPARAQDGPGVDDPVGLLREYLQIDTTNPPGNEGEAADLLAAHLRDAGLETRRLVSPEGRVSLWARWRAESGVDGPALVLMHHIDVVPAGDDWRVPPFSGRVHDGKVWGRGALDVKGLGVAQLVALGSLARSGLRPAKDVIYLAVADEETGGGQGAGWLLDAHPELFAGVEGVLNEGGVNRTLRGHLAWWGVEVAQKRPLWLKVTARGRGGHASGFHPASATHRLIRGLARLVEESLDYRMTEPARIYFGALADLGAETTDDAAGSSTAALEAALASDDPQRHLMPGMHVYFVDTLQVTRVETGTASNVVAPEAVAWIDARLLPDTDAAARVASIREMLGPDLEVEVLLESPPSPPSPRDHPLWNAVALVLEQRGPVVPTFLSGTTDSRYFRQRGIAAYGFSPFALDGADGGGIHAADEAVPVDEFLRGIETMRRILEAYVAPVEPAGGSG